MSLLSVTNITKEFVVSRTLWGAPKEVLRAVRGVSLQIPAGKVMGLVGESACGKSTLGRAILRLIEPTAGEVVLDGQPVTGADRTALRQLRRKMQIIFQDPYASLNPRMKAGSIVGEALKVHKIVPKDKIRERTRELFASVGLPDNALDRYPHEFSGGQRQRIGIARALAVEPRFIIADEPISALDVSIQAQIINLLHDLKEKHGLTYLFISHDLRVVGHFCDEVAVMYFGLIVEQAPAKTLREKPAHPYTRLLLSSIPVSHPRDRKPRSDKLEEIPNPLRPPTGCAFHPRCPYATDICRTQPVELKPLASDPGRLVACHRAAEIA